MQKKPFGNLLSLLTLFILMKIWKHIESLTFKCPVVTIGIFDGVHIGHKHVLNRLIDLASSYKGESVVVTLWPHPRLVLNKETENLRYLNTFEEKVLLLERSGIDHLVVIEFTKEFAQLDSCAFIKDILVEKIGIKHLVVGYNHKFGKNRQGDFRNLQECAGIYNFTIEQTTAVSENGKIFSSTAIRENLLEGDIDEANSGLGYDYFLQGKVVDGMRIGRELGFPTANIVPHDDHKLIPSDGVYAVNIQIDEITYNGMLNIGYRPTMHSDIPVKTIEVNVFDFDQDMYGKSLTLIFRKRIRDEKKFENIEQLRAQLGLDKNKALNILEKNSY